jgi:acyl-CoA thioesterase-1
MAMRKILWIVLLLSIGAARAAAPVILVMGDSLSAGYGIDVSRGWVDLLQARLKTKSYTYRVVNASVSGETTRAGLARLPRALKRYSPAVVLIELGGNDGLRGLSLKAMKKNLAKMIGLSRKAGAKVLLVGVRLPPNYGPSYTHAFAAVYSSLARRYAVPLVPFLLAGVAANRARMQPRGLHPKASAEPRLLNNVWPKLVPLLSGGAGQ